MRVPVFADGCLIGGLPVIGAVLGVGEGRVLLLGCFEPGGVVVEEGSQLCEAPVLQQAWVAR